MSDLTKPHAEDFITVNKLSFTYQDINSVVDDFYGRIQKDSLLSIPFQSVHDWPEHIDNITHFWWIRLGGKPYMFSEYNPVAKHFFAGFNADLLKRWLDIFKATLNDHLSTEKANLWWLIAQKIGEALTYKNEIFAQQYKK